jgi:hypothetical protein
MTVYCPHCGQRVLIRLGAMLSPREVDVFDVIARQSESGGIRSDVLADMFKGGQGCLKVHVSNINKKLNRNGWQIVCEREGSAKGFYRIRQERQRRGTQTEINDGALCRGVLMASIDR